MFYFNFNSAVSLMTLNKARKKTVSNQKNIQVKNSQHSPASCAVTSDIRKPWLLAQSWEENEVKTHIYTLYSSIKLSGLLWENPINSHTFIIFIYFWFELYLSAIAGFGLWPELSFTRPFGNHCLTHTDSSLFHYFVLWLVCIHVFAFNFWWWCELMLNKK